MPNLRLRKQDKENHLFPDDPLGMLIALFALQSCEQCCRLFVLLSLHITTRTVGFKSLCLHRSRKWFFTLSSHLDTANSIKMAVKTSKHLWQGCIFFALLYSLIFLVCSLTGHPAQSNPMTYLMPGKWNDHSTWCLIYEQAQFVTWSSWSAVQRGKNYTMKQRQ